MRFHTSWCWFFMFFVWLVGLLSISVPGATILPPAEWALSGLRNSNFPEPDKILKISPPTFRELRAIHMLWCLYRMHCGWRETKVHMAFTELYVSFLGDPSSIIPVFPLGKTGIFKLYLFLPVPCQPQMDALLLLVLCNPKSSGVQSYLRPYCELDTFIPELLALQLVEPSYSSLIIHDKNTSILNIPESSYISTDRVYQWYVFVKAMN